MRHRRVVICCFFTILQSGCGKDLDAQLRDRAQAWGDLLFSLKTMGQEDAVKRLEEFIEPSAGRSQRAKEYYENFSNSSNAIIAHSVDDVKIAESRIDANVRYTTIFENPDGTRLTASQVTQWKCVNNQWYRVIIRPSITVNSP